MNKITLDFDKLVGVGSELEIKYSIEREDTLWIASPIWYLLDIEIQEIIFNETTNVENYKSKEEKLYNLENDYRDNYEYEKGDE